MTRRILAAIVQGRAEVARKALRDYLKRAPAGRYAQERTQAAEVLRGL